MVFSSALFLLYFLPIFIVAYFFVAQRFRNILTLAFSIFFYAWGAPRFLFLVILSTVLTFYLVQALHKESRRKQRRWLLTSAVGLNLGLLLYFKYANFFVENLNELLSGLGMTNLEWTAVALPIGISFFTFQSLTYAVDVYRKVHDPLRKLTDYMLYIMMFPQMIAGPIVRFNTIADQIEHRNTTAEDRLLGFYRFTIGLAKKVLIANVMGAVADDILAREFVHMNSTTAWIGILAYTFQIYFDFSGYSDMAIGIGRMIGFRFPENFNNPYISQSITEFWRRWHMTLGAWMKDYLYIPLGGNRVKSKTRLYFNLGFVFLLSGLWHGASWNFVLWGAFHGVFLILDRIFLIRILNKLGKYPSVLITFFLAVMGWVLFRIEDFNAAMTFYGRLFAFDFSSLSLNDSGRFFLILPFALIFSWITLSKYGLRLQDKVFYSSYSIKGSLIMLIVVIVLLGFSLASVTSSGFNPFIYFRF